jgi:hypothetical protein
MIEKQELCSYSNVKVNRFSYVVSNHSLILAIILRTAVDYLL